jgi:hypothetical protein
MLPNLLRERLNEGERALIERAAADDAAVASANDCVLRLKRDRLQRECVAVQDEIDRLQRGPGLSDQELARLWERKKWLLARLEEFHDA